MKKTVYMTHEIIRRYGDVNGDHDTNHYDDGFAQQQGYKAAVAHGLLVSGYAVGLAAEKYGREFHYHGEFEMKYVAGTCAGDTLLVQLTEEGQIEARVEDGLTAVGYARLRADDGTDRLGRA